MQITKPFSEVFNIFGAQIFFEREVENCPPFVNKLLNFGRRFSNFLRLNKASYPKPFTTGVNFRIVRVSIDRFESNSESP
ncbi:MAG: hypothetical protein QXP56_07240, partial [Archaeoglobaceae archaeon]